MLKKIMIVLAMTPGLGRAVPTGTEGGTGVAAKQFDADVERVFNQRMKTVKQDSVPLDEVLSAFHNGEVTVNVVDVLKDPDTGKAIPDQEDLIAWGSLGLIQLKASYWPKAYETRDPGLAYQDETIAHEVFRSTKFGKLDKTFHLSRDVFHLDVPQPAYKNYLELTHWALLANRHNFYPDSPGWCAYHVEVGAMGAYSLPGLVYSPADDVVSEDFSSSPRSLSFLSWWHDTHSLLKKGFNFESINNPKFSNETCNSLGRVTVVECDVADLQSGMVCALMEKGGNSVYLQGKDGDLIVGNVKYHRE